MMFNAAILSLMFLSACGEVDSSMTTSPSTPSRGVDCEFPTAAQASRVPFGRVASSFVIRLVWTSNSSIRTFCRSNSLNHFFIWSAARFSEFVADSLFPICFASVSMNLYAELVSNGCILLFFSFDWGVKVSLRWVGRG